MIVIIVAVFAVRRSRAQRLESRRVEAGEHRELARDRQLDADRQQAEADVSAARAKRDAAIAEQKSSEADRTRSEAADIAQQARELDPDDDDGQADSPA
ncbi:MAG TPA: hypothetical protein VM282_22605 [Acidimicrobiales bacterium]|nr:hypothetical protein [Acidimicrobiales bacterium]